MFKYVIDRVEDKIQSIIRCELSAVVIMEIISLVVVYTVWNFLYV